MENRTTGVTIWVDLKGMSRATKMHQIAVSTAELELITQFLTCFLGSDCHGVIDGTDPASVLKAWKADRGNYLASQKAHDEKMGDKFDRVDHRSDLKAHDQEAALLTRLYPLLKAVA
jgi:hypothetical protein